MIDASVSASTPSVGSSSSRRGRSASTARASATRRCCRWTARCRPRRPGCRAGRRARPPRRPRATRSRGRRRVDPAGCCRRPCPRPDGRCGTQAMRRSQASRSTSARSTPPTGTRPLVRRAQSEQQVEQRRLARCRWARAPRARCPAPAVRSSPPRIRPDRARRPPTPSSRIATRAGSGAGTRPAPPGGLRLQHRERLGRGGEAFRACRGSGRRPRAAAGRPPGRGSARAGRWPGRGDPRPGAARRDTATSATDRVASSSSTSAERNATRSVRMVARRYSVGQRAQARRLVRCPAERDQHVEARDEVEEVVAEHGEGPPLPPRGALRCAARRGS